MIQMVPEEIAKGIIMNTDVKYLLKLGDGRNEPIKDLNNATRVVLVDKDTVGAEDITSHLFAVKVCSGLSSSVMKLPPRILSANASQTVCYSTRSKAI